MLSEIVARDRLASSRLRPFTPPSPDELRLQVEERRLESDRRRIIDGNRGDPVGAAQAEANRILADAQDKLRQAEAQTSLLAAQKEKELRARLERELTETIGQNVRQLEKRLADTLAGLVDLRETIYRETQDELLNLTFSVIRKIIGQEVKTAPNIILDMLKKGFEKIKEASRYEVHVSPPDYDILQNNREHMRELLQTAGALKFVKDETVERGGCRIVTDSGEVSSEPGKQLEVIIKELQHAP